jgi:DNA-binding transcriptional MerR regulator
MENLRGEFIRHTRKEREELRSYLEQFRNSGSRTYTNRRETTLEHIASVEDEIRELDKVIALGAVAGW